MNLRPTARSLAALSVAALATGSLVLTAPAAQAAPVFVDAETYLDPYNDVYLNGGACTAGPENNGNTVDVPVIENGPVASAGSSASGSYTANGNPADVISAFSQVSGTGSVTSVGGVLSSMDFSASGSSTVVATPSVPVSACNIYSYAGIDLEFEFAVTQAGFLDLSMSSTGGVYSEVYIYTDDPTGNDPYYDNYGRGLKFSSDTTVYLPVGTYEGYFAAQPGVGGTSSRNLGGTTTVSADFNVAGSQTAAVAGKAKQYVSFPAARSCATDSIDTSITAKGKKAKKIKSVKYFVNDKLVKKAKTPKKKAVVALPVADGVDADVRVAVKLFPAKKGKPSKTQESTASYEACS